jgi:hypothetical protein
VDVVLGRSRIGLRNTRKGFANDAAWERARRSWGDIFFKISEMRVDLRSRGEERKERNLEGKGNCAKYS